MTKKRVPEKAAETESPVTPPRQSRPLTLRIVNGRVFVVEPNGAMRPWGRASDLTKESVVGIQPVEEPTAAHSHDPDGLWHRGPGPEDYSTEICLRPKDGFNCPKCGKVVTKGHLTKTDKDRSGEDIYGYHFGHPCGAKLLIIND